MDRDDKDFKIIEKVIKEREERKKEYAVDENTGFFPKKNLVPSPVKKSKMKHIDAVILIIVIIGLLTWISWSIVHEEIEHESIVYPANVVLDSFNDGSKGLYISSGLVWPPMEIEIQPDYVGVLFELKNTGDEAATDVSCFIKCCDQNGTILFAQLFTFGDIWPDTVGKISASSSYRIQVPATGSYRVPISDETLYITHSIDVRWSQGVNTYMKLTEV